MAPNLQSVPMTVDTAPPPPEGTRRRMPTWAKVLLGAGIGCALLGMILVGACAFGTWWVMSPGEQYDPAAFVDGRTVGVVVAPDPAADDGVRALAAHVLTAANRRNREQSMESLPDSMRWMERLQNNEANAATGAGMMIPKSAAVVLQRDADTGGVDAVGVVNLASMARLYRYAIESASRGPGKFEHRDVSVVGMGRDRYVGFLGGTWLVTESQDAMRRAIDRALDRDGEDGTTPWDDRPEDWDVVVRVDNEIGDAAGHIDRALAFLGLPGTDLGRTLGSIDGGLDVVSADRVRGGFDLAFSDEAAASTAEDGLRTMTANWNDRLVQRGGAATFEVRREGATVRVAVDVEGLDRVIDVLFERLVPGAGS